MSETTQDSELFPRGVGEPTVTDCLDEIRRIRAENERLKRLVKAQWPTLDQLRNVEVALRDFRRWHQSKLEEAHEAVLRLLPNGDDDLPSVEEIGGILSEGADRVDAAIAAQAEYQRGVADTLAKVRALPSPIHDSREDIVSSGELTMTIWAHCKWCGAAWENHPRERDVASRHPETDCLWSQAHRAGAATPAQEDK